MRSTLPAARARSATHPPPHPTPRPPRAPYIAALVRHGLLLRDKQLRIGEAVVLQTRMHAGVTVKEIVCMLGSYASAVTTVVHIQVLVQAGFGWQALGLSVSEQPTLAISATMTCLAQEAATWGGRWVRH